MLIQKINTAYNKQPYKTSAKSNYTQTVSFKSNRAHEETLRRLREAQAAEMKRRFQHLEELHNYNIKDNGCHNMAQFMLNFVCTIENDSEHNLDEFFASEVEAANLRRNLSPECQQNSLEIREEIQSQPVFKDPVLALITAKDMKDFVPVDEEFAKDKMFVDTINAAKRSFIQVVNVADKTKFDNYEIGLMKDLTQIINKAKGLDFGIQYEETLEKLINSVKRRKQQLETLQVRQKITNPNILRRIKR